MTDAVPPTRRPPRLVRPYVVTRGRTAATGVRLPLDAAIEARRAPDELDRTATPEARRILGICRVPVALAEVAARLPLPVGAVRVLVGDLSAVGAVAVVEPVEREPATDVRLLERLLRGIRAL